ncbi:MAG: hypothetical protein LBN33_09415 [Desulfovibrio sp.]|jgi:nickel transport protein|nr:hypothetical protein [Desulfovibrio sp.]
MTLPRCDTRRLRAAPSLCELPRPVGSESRAILLPVCLLLWIILGAAPAAAHSVFIYAWQEEGGRICTNSYFSKKNKVRGAEVRMESPEGQVLDRGVSGPDGLCCFAAQPETGDLRFIVNAGQGHRAEFLLPGVQSGPTSRSEPASRPGVSSRSGAPVEADPFREPSLRDIVGGMGWLVGLAGLGAYAVSRRKKG